jgi:hypothetical protein
MAVTYHGEDATSRWLEETGLRTLESHEQHTHRNCPQRAPPLCRGGQADMGCNPSPGEFWGHVWFELVSTSSHDGGAPDSLGEAAEEAQSSEAVASLREMPSSMLLRRRSNCRDAAQ